MPNIEEHLRKAMADGKFDDLPGKGKPLHLSETNPHADPGWELAYSMLKDAGYSLPWIETIRTIEADIETARKELNLAWQCYRDDYTQAEPSGYLSAEWERAQQEFKNKLTELNKRIRDYNLEVPITRFQRPVLDYVRELKKATE